MTSWDVVMRQQGDKIAVECRPTDPAVDAARYMMRLVGFPVAFNSVGAAEGPTLDFGQAPASAGHLFPIHPSTGYGPYSMIVMLEPLDGGGPELSAAVGMVLRRPDKAYGVTLKREAAGTDVRTLQDCTGYRLRVQVAETVGIPKALFLHRTSHDALGRLKDDFLAVCRPPDFAEYPENKPNDDFGKYRLPYVDVVMHHPNELEALWKGISEDVQRLVASMEANRRLESAETVVL